MPRHRVIACEVFRDEFGACEAPGFDFSFLPQGYHRTPGKMPPLIQEEVDRVPEGVDAIVLGYGLCSNGVVGLRAGHAPLVMPRIHDCIALLLGSREVYEREAAACPGTYYLTRGWIDHAKTPYSEYRGEYREKYGEENAAWIVRELMKHYKRVVLVDHGIGAMDRYRDEARAMAEFFGLACEEMAGSLDYIRRLLSGPWDDEEDFLVVPPGETIEQHPFLCLKPICLA